jgi:hypothetical protein
MTKIALLGCVTHSSVVGFKFNAASTVSIAW